MSNDQTGKVISVPHAVGDKVGATDDAGPDFDAIQDIVNRFGAEFVERLPGELAAIGAALSVLKAEPASEDARKKLFGLVHDLKGQAGTFDYMLLTVVGNDWCRFIEHADPITPRHLQVMDFFLDALNRIAEQRMTGFDEALANRMIETLHAMTQKVLQE